VNVRPQELFDFATAQSGAARHEIGEAALPAASDKPNSYQRPYGITL
jgi:hypothetical protein